MSKCRKKDPKVRPKFENLRGIWSMKYLVVKKSQRRYMYNWENHSNNFKSFGKTQKK